MVIRKDGEGASFQNHGENFFIHLKLQLSILGVVY